MTLQLLAPLLVLNNAAIFGSVNNLATLLIILRPWAVNLCNADVLICHLPTPAWVCLFQLFRTLTKQQDCQAYLEAKTLWVISTFAWLYQFSWKGQGDWRCSDCNPFRGRIDTLLQALLLDLELVFSTEGKGIWYRLPHSHQKPHKEDPCVGSKLPDVMLDLVTVCLDSLSARPSKCASLCLAETE